MKDLYCVRKKDIEKLAKMNLLPSTAIIQEDGKSEFDESPTYAVFFETSRERNLAFEAIYGDSRFIFP